MRTSDHLLGELKAVRSNRPSVGMVEDVRVEAYGQTMEVKQLGSLSIRPPREIEVNVWDHSVIGAVAKAIENAKMGFSVAVDGTTVRVTLPPLTDERRAELTKMVRKMTEEARIAVRGERDEAIKELKLQAGISEDQVFKSKAQIQKVVDAANEKIETALESKLQELGE